MQEKQGGGDLGFLGSLVWAGGRQIGGGQGAPHSAPYPGVRRRWCGFGVSLRAWVGAWRPHSRGQRGRQRWQRRPAAWGLQSQQPHLRRRGLGGRRRRGGEGRTPGLAATEATWLMGRGLQGLDRVGSATSLASHLQGHSGVLVAPKDGILSWRNELPSFGSPRSTMLVAREPSIRFCFHAGPLPSCAPVHAAMGL